MGEPDSATRRHEADASYVFSDQVGYLLRRAYQRHLAIFQTHACDAHLTSVQFSTLCALRDGGAQSQGELVKATGVDQATIRGVIDRLKKRGLVALFKDAQDARKVMTALTDAGAALLEQMIPCASDITELTFGPLNAVERTALLYTLRRMLEDETGES